MRRGSRGLTFAATAPAESTNEIAIGWVHEAGNNGIVDEIDGYYMIGAESTTAVGGYASWTHQNILVHEFGHLFFGLHFPFDGNPYHCGTYHRHWWGWQWHSYDSVMNYCHSYAGTADWDSTNFQVVYDNIHDSTATAAR